MRTRADEVGQTGPPANGIVNQIFGVLIMPQYAGSLGFRPQTRRWQLPLPRGEATFDGRAYALNLSPSAGLANLIALSKSTNCFPSHAFLPGSRRPQCRSLAEDRNDMLAAGQ